MAPYCFISTFKQYKEVTTSDAKPCKGTKKIFTTKGQSLKGASQQCFGSSGKYFYSMASTQTV